MENQQPFELPRRPAHTGNRRINPQQEAPLLPDWTWVKSWLSNRYVWTTAGVLSLLILGFIWWVPTWITVQRVEFLGNARADLTELRQLVKIQDGITKMGEVNEDSVLAQVKRHAWVEAATVSRGWGGLVEVEVRERIPVLLCMNPDGVPAYYVDQNGYPMPFIKGGAFNVPLLVGVSMRYKPNQLVAHATVRRLAADLATLDPETTALISSLALTTSGVIGYTTPIGNRETIQLRLGRSHFDERLVKLKAFWEQAVLPYPKKNIGIIDLRFDGQVITRETEKTVL